MTTDPPSSPNRACFRAQIYHSPTHAVTAAGRTTASVTATPVATVTVTATTTAPTLIRACGSTWITVFVPATRIATIERNPGKGNRHWSLQRKKPPYLPRAPFVLSVAGLSRRSGDRGPQSGGISRCRQWLPEPIAKQNFLRPLPSTCQPGTVEAKEVNKQGRG